MKPLQKIFLPKSIKPIHIICVLICLSLLQSAQAQPGQRVITPLVDTIYSVQFSPDSRTLAIARGSRDDNRVELWDTQGGTLRHTIRGFDGTVWSVSFSPDGRTLVTGSGNASVVIWEVQTGKLSRVLR